MNWKRRLLARVSLVSRGVMPTVCLGLVLARVASHTLTHGQHKKPDNVSLHSGQHPADEFPALSSFEFRLCFAYVKLHGQEAEEATRQVELYKRGQDL